jgi:hypothetical protein
VRFWALLPPAAQCYVHTHTHSCIICWGRPAPPPVEDLLDCARYGEVDDVKALLESGVDANATDDGGTAALHKGTSRMRRGGVG